MNPANRLSTKLPRRFVVEFDGFRKFTFRERLQILFGYNAVAKAKALIDSRLGSCKTNCFIGLTKHVAADGQAKETIREEEA